MPQREPLAAALMPARLLSAGVQLCPHCRGALPADQALAYCLSCGAQLSAEMASEAADLWGDPSTQSPGESTDPSPSDAAPAKRPREAYDPAQWQVKTAPQPPAAPPLPRGVPRDSPVALTGWALELWVRRLAVPVALLIALVFHLSSVGRFFQRVVLGMMVHETGHALTAWFAGFWAVPLPWVTRIGDHRSLAWSLAVTAALALAISIGRRREQLWLVVCASASLGLQGWLTWGLSESDAQALIIWGGDGAGIPLAAALIAMFPLGSRALLVRGGLRWGFLVIGAGAFVDLAMPWVEALGDPAAIPYGRIEGVGLSDPSRMTDTYGWLQSELIRSYLATALLSLGFIALSWWWGVRNAVFQRQSGAVLGDD